MWDEQASERVDAFIANSEHVSQRIKKYYRKDASVIYPPVNCSKFFLCGKSDFPHKNSYFLMVGRLVPYKKFSLAIAAFNRLGLKLKIIGDGPERCNLEKAAHSNIEFLGLVSEQYISEYYARANALIFPQEEDFGVVAVESMASGRPVIAYRAGGALEIIKEGDL
jgi:glycosyltransferase involved in cell wall biosynthesis